MKQRTENWNGRAIRFIEKEPGEWWAVAKDISDALCFSQARDATRKLPAKYKDVYKVPTTSKMAKCPETQEMIVISEKGLYRLIMRSNKPEAEAFQDWVFDVIKQLRQSTGLEGFQVFRMLDKEHQREAMGRLHEGLSNPVQVDFIKANSIANKAVSTRYGYPKMIKKAEMSPEMLIDRQRVLDETVSLMAMNERFNLDISVSQAVYRRYVGWTSPSPTHPERRGN